MKKWKLKKTWSIVLLLVFVFMTVVNVALPDVALAASDIELTHNFTGTLHEGMSNFSVTFTVTNKSGAPIDDVSLDFSGAGIMVPAGSDMGKTIISHTGAVNDGAFDSFPLTMKFIGDGSSGFAKVKVNYTKGGSPESETVTLYFNTEKPSDPQPTPDPDLYKPVLVPSVADNTTVTAGVDTGVKLVIKNASTSYMSRNITFSTEPDENFTSTKVLTTMPVKEILANQSTEITLSINANKYIQPGIYPYKFKLTYQGAFTKEYTTEYTVYINVQNLNSATKLTVQTSSADNVQAVAGKSFSVPVYLVNSGSFYAKDVSVTLKGLSQDGFTLASGAGKLNFDKVDAKGNVKFTLNLLADSSMKTGSYPLSFEVVYTPEKGGTPVVEDQQIWIPVAGSGAQVTQVEVLDISTSKTNLAASDIFDVTVKIKNSGNTKAEQLKVSADGTSALLPVTQNLFIVSSLAPGETKTLTFKFQVSPDAARGSVPIVIKVDNLDGQNGSISQAVSVFLDTSGKDDDNNPAKNVPKIIVNTYSYDPGTVKAGEQFTLNISFLNTHSTKTIRNIRGSFTVENKSNESGNVFTPVDCSNTFYIDSITPKDTYDWNLRLYTIPDALSKTYTVTLSFDYEDEHGNPFTTTEIIGIPVYQPSRLEVSDISLPSETFMGQPIYASFSLYNMGKTELYNVKMSVEGDFMAEPKSTYFGNFTSGYQEYSEIMLNPMNIGMLSGKIVVEYETPSGEAQRFEKEFTMNVMDMPMMDPGFPVDGGKPGFPMEPGMEGGEPAQGGFIGSVWFFVIIGVVVAAVVVVIIVVVKKRKKSKEFEF